MDEFYSHSFEDIVVYQTPTLWRTYRNYNYIIAQENKAVIIDPGDFSPIQNTIEKNQLSIKAILLTHHHADHVAATKQLTKAHPCEVLGFSKDQKRLPPLTKTYNEDEILKIAGHECKILFFPGHTLGLCAFYFEDLNLLFSNDLIFSLGCGRVFEGTHQQMFESLKKLRDLPEETLLFPSHEYTLANLEFGQHLFPEDQKLKEVEKDIKSKLLELTPTVPTTLAFEKANNPFLRWDDPMIRKALEMDEAEDWQVFSEIRRLKDQA